ncbi:myb-like protein I [Condylostylus longicornis]|uniref:myb-like protein I n=1 Tax=Condylostylus longicornis TaxID=2530218 RepID=UPI00244E4875|nr:myb-like protein I [Condylostylus longicornis]
MLLISALALGLIETVNPSSNNLQFDYNIGSTIKYLNNNYKNFYHSSSTTATASAAAATAAIVAKAPVSSASLSHTKFKNNLKYNNNYYKKDNDNNDFINNNDNNNEIIDNVMAKAMTPYYNNHHQYHQYHQSSGQSSTQLKKGITSVSKTIETPATATLTKRTPLLATTETTIAAALASGTVTSILPINTAESLKSSDLLENYQKYYQNSVDYNKNNFNKNNNKNNYNLNSEGAIIIKTRSTTETTTETIILDSVIISDNNNYNNNNNSNGANLLWNQFIYNNKTNNHLNRTNNLNNFDNNNNKNNNNINKNNNNNNYNYIKNKIRYQKNNNNMMLMMPSGIDSSSIIDNSGNIIGGSINGIGNSIGNTGIIDDNNGGTVNFDDWSIKQCLIWSRPYEIYFQLSNAFFLIAFIAPNSPYGMLWMRSFLLIGCVLMATYGWFIQCRPDVILWSGLFLSVNFIYLIILICRLRPIRFEKEIEAVSEPQMSEL